jgi:hypothetical protein
MWLGCRAGRVAGPVGVWETLGLRGRSRSSYWRFETVHLVIDARIMKVIVSVVPAVVMLLISVLLDIIQ